MTYRLEPKLARGASARRFVGRSRLFEDVVLEPRLLGGRIPIWAETDRDVWRRTFTRFLLGRRRAADHFEQIIRSHDESYRTQREARR